MQDGEEWMVFSDSMKMGRLHGLDGLDGLDVKCTVIQWCITPNRTLLYDLNPGLIWNGGSRWICSYHPISSHNIIYLHGIFVRSQGPDIYHVLLPTHTNAKLKFRWCTCLAGSTASWTHPWSSHPSCCSLQMLCWSMRRRVRPFLESAHQSPTFKHLAFSTHLRYDKIWILIVHDNKVQCSNVVVASCLVSLMSSISWHGDTQTLEIRFDKWHACIDAGPWVKELLYLRSQAGDSDPVMLRDNPWHKHHTSTECWAGDATIQGESGRELGILHDELLVVTEAIVCR